MIKEIVALLGVPVEKTYVIWSPENVNSHALHNHAGSDYEVLLYVESEVGCLSSVVKTSDIKQLVEAVYNETNITICYKELK